MTEEMTNDERINLIRQGLVTENMKNGLKQGLKRSKWP